jgi:hypothetical protein
LDETEKCDGGALASPFFYDERRWRMGHESAKSRAFTWPAQK